jgi:hypothetical protein
MLKPVVYKSLMLVKLSGLVSKLSLLFTAISTIATLFDRIESEMGWAINAICIAAWLMAKNLAMGGYEKTRHIPPVASKKSYSLTSSHISKDFD